MKGLLKNNSKEIFTAFFGSLVANIGLMMIYFYLHKNHGLFEGLDVARYTSIAVVITPLITGIICYARHKNKDDSVGAVITVSLISLAAAFIGCISGAVIAANIFGKMNG